MINKRLINTGVEAAPAAFDPLQNFETVTYTGNGSTQKITGYIRKGAAFNGSSSYIQTSLSPSYSTISHSLWFYADSADSTNALYYFDNRGGRIDINITGTGSNSVSNSLETVNITATTATSQWNHLLLVYTGWASSYSAGSYGSAITVTAYLNGSSIGTASPTPYGQTIGMRIGRSGGGYYFEGRVDQFRVFNSDVSSNISTLTGETYASSTKSTTDIFGDGSGVALYELDEDAKVSGGNPNQGFKIDSTQSATFNGSSSSVNLGSTNQFASSGVSVSMWINPSSVTTNQMLIANQNGGSFEEGDLFIGIRTDGYIGYEIGQSASIYEARYSTTTQLSVGNWYHITVTFDSSLGTTIGKIYVNGTLQSTSATYAAGGTFSGDVFIGTLDLQLGKRNITGSELWYNGKMDEVRIYSSVLTPSEIINTYIDYNIPTNNLVSLYKLDGDATDEQGNYNGIATSISYSGTVPQVPSHPYNGTPTNVNFLGMAFQPDLVWVKRRTAAVAGPIFDSIRGVYKRIYPSLTNAEATNTSSLTSFDSNGFSVGADTQTNQSGGDIVAWCWKAGGVPTPNNNTQGTITSTVSANQAAGFSIVKWSADGSANGQVGHGLSATPELVITKSLSSSGWWTLTTVIDGSLDYLRLDTTAAKVNTSGLTISSTTITNWGYALEDVIAYCFHSVDGYQKIGSYTGNGNASFGTSAVAQSINTGFRPRFVLIKITSAADHWIIFDSVRKNTSTTYSQYQTLYPNLANAEGNASSGGGYWHMVDFTDTGFDLGQDPSLLVNKSGATYIYLAIA